MIPLGLITFAGRAWSVARQVPWYVWLTAAVALAFVVNGAYEHHQGVVEGKKSVVEDLVKQDRKLESDADKAQLRVEECYNAGGEWDTSMSRCTSKLKRITR